MEDKYIILADVTCDLPVKYLEERKIELVDLHYSIDGSEYDQLGDNQISLKEFYDRMRNGSRTKTAQVTPESAKKVLERHAKKGMPVLALIFSSGISGSYNSVRIAGEELKQEYPNWKFCIVDTLCASSGDGLLIDDAADYRDNGMSFDDICKWAEESKLNYCHLFTVENLSYLHRGGRVSKATAIIGTLLNIKPCLHVDNEGKLIKLTTAKGRRGSLKWLVDTMYKLVDGKYDDKVFISHADSVVEAQQVIDDIREKFGLSQDKVMINNIGPVIGSHAGPGTMALFFKAKTRK